MSVQLSDLQGCSKEVWATANCTLAEFTQQFAPPGFRGVLVVDGWTYATDDPTKLHQGSTVLFVWTLSITLNSASSSTMPFSVLANQEVREIRRLCPGKTQPGDCFYYRGQLLDETKSFGVQDVANNAVITTQFGQSPIPPYNPSPKTAPALPSFQAGFRPAPVPTVTMQGFPVPQARAPTRFNWQVSELSRDFGLPADHFDSVGDQDFSLSPISPSMRGGQAYYPPNGWKRYGLKVRGLFENDIWLEKTNGPWEWPVSYHGTSIANAKGILARGYDMDKKVRGYGIYSAQQITVALDYCQIFNYQGQRWVAVLMNRVHYHPSKMNRSGVPGNYIYVALSDKDIRPYGLLIRDIY